MRDNVGIAELSSPMLRDLLREACTGIGRVAVYPTVQDATFALARNPPKVLVVGGAPIEPGLLDLLERATTSLGVLGLALADTHDLQLALQSGAIEGFPRTPEGLRQLSLRLRPLLAPSLRPVPSASQRAQPATPSLAGPSMHAVPARECAVIVLGSLAARGDAIGYLLSRLPNTLPGIVLVHGHIQPEAELIHLLAEECTWRLHEAGEPGLIEPGSLWITQQNAGFRIERTEAGLRLARGEPAAQAGRPDPRTGVDRFFEHVAQVVGGGALGVMLGAAANDEGSRGLCALRRAGSYTLAQRDPNHQGSDHPAYGSNRPAAAHEVLGLERLPQAISAFCQGRNSYRNLPPHSL